MFGTIEERKGYARNFAALFIILTVGGMILFFGLRDYSLAGAAVSFTIYFFSTLGESLLLALSLCCFYHGYYVYIKKVQQNKDRYLGAPTYTFSSIICNMPYGFLGMIGFLPYYIYNLYLIRKG